MKWSFSNKWTACLYSCAMTGTCYFLIGQWWRLFVTYIWSHSSLVHRLIGLAKILWDMRHKKHYLMGIQNEKLLSIMLIPWRCFFFVPIYHKSVSMDQGKVSVYHHKCFNDGQAMTHCTTLTETPSFTLGKRTHEKRKQPACFYGLEFPAS